MSFIAAAIGGSALLGAGASIYSGSQQANAAKGAAAVQGDAINQATQTSIAGGRDALAYLDPFRQYGLNAGSSLQAALYSPQQQAQQQASQKAALEGEVARLQALAPKWDTYQILTGKNASERRAAMFTQENQIAQQKIAEAQSKLDTFNKQAAANPISQQGPTIQESPWYQFQAGLLNRSMDRSMAAQGLTGSGAAMEERRMGLLQLGAQETENQFNRMAHLYDVGANAANAGAGAITGTSQAIANNQIAGGQAQAQGLMNVAGANAGIATNIANSVSGAVGTGLNYYQFQNLINANKPAGSNPSSTAYDRYGGNLDAYGTPGRY